jgi:hypothetical protein
MSPVALEMPVDAALLHRRRMTGSLVMGSPQRIMEHIPSAGMEFFAKQKGLSIEISSELRQRMAAEEVTPLDIVVLIEMLLDGKLQYRRDVIGS